MSTNFEPFPSLRGRRYSPINIVVHNPKLLNKKRIILAFSLVIVVGSLFIITNQPSSSLNRTALSFINFHGNSKTNLEQGFCHSEFSFASLCSCEADRRGLHQNVIAYSLYGNFSDPKLFTRYVEPIKIILANISQSYPGWIMRIYSKMEHNDQIGNLKLKEMFADYPFVDLCNVTRLLEVHNITRPLFPMTWRFLPLMDPTVDRLLPRDSDSLITAREVDAVHDWITNSSATFHIMRDHWFHCDTQILGGLWGVKIHQKRQAILQVSEMIFYETQHQLIYGFDETILTKFIWPLAIDDAISHDSYCCGLYNGTKGFPTRRQGTEYAGQIIHQLYSPVPESCPEICRPTNHRDWINC